MSTVELVNSDATGPDTRTIVICTTGGTIAASTDPGGVVTAGSHGAVETSTARMAAELEAVLPETIRVRWRPVLDLDSSAMGPGEFDAVVDAVEAALGDPEVAGVVVTHGTDTLEETAMLLDLHHGDPRPVVLTGAQRAADHPDADGPANLLDAVLVAADEVSRSLGVLVVLGRAVLQARGVRKWHTTDLIGFARNAPDPQQDVDPSELPEELVRPVLPRRVRLSGIRVDTVHAAPGADDAALRACVAAGARGIVVEGLGSGNLPPLLASGLRTVLAEHPELAVVVTSRVPRGEVSAVYGGPGGGAELARAGVVFSGHLRAGQCRVLLGCLIALSASGAGSDTAAHAHDGSVVSVGRLWDRFARVTA